FATIDDALTARNERIEQNIREKKEKLLNEPIKRNDQGIAIIELFNRKKEKVGETMVSDEDYWTIKQYSCNMRKGYVNSTICGKTVTLSRFIMKYDGKDFVDHIDGNRLNNQRSNLRILTAAQNSQNKASTKNGTSK